MAEPRPRPVGVLASYDFDQREELRRWLAPRAEYTLAFTDEVPYRDNLELVSRLGRPALLAEPVRELVARGAEAVAYLCTACSFVDGVAGERALRAAMLGYGAPRALTTSGAAVDALRAVGARRVAVVHPYQEPVGARLAAYLAECGLDVVGLTALGLDAVEDVYTVAREQVVDAVVAGDRPEADAVFVSCTSLPTYDALPHLREHLGKPVVSAVQATAWALLEDPPARLTASCASPS
ncbi:Asp/Glu racemase [Streptomyces sp. NPDC016845]|uniref:aspartate racemase/maleate isomerase family protein n=1 Tax=Streptomyces sp. NPDC016845 TaxID=3364972 RepID=UPI0037ADE343